TRRPARRERRNERHRWVFSNGAGPIMRGLRLDVLSVAGVILGMAAILLGSVLKGSGLSALWNVAAFVIVIVGTVAAVLVQVRLPVFVHALKIVRWIFLPPDSDGEEALNRILEWSRIARRDGLLGL